MVHRNGGPPRRQFALANSLADVIALDGPPGSGKGTAAREIARNLRYTLLDSGALYRLVALRAEQTSTSITDIDTLVALAKSNLPVFTTDGWVMLRGKNYDPQLRSGRIESLTPKVAKIPEVREAVRHALMSYRVPPGLVTDGRDQYHLFSRESDGHRKATYGFFVTAIPEVRAARIAQRRMDKGEKSVDLSRILEELQARDNTDRTRAVAPFEKHPDAIEIDTSNTTPAVVVETIISMYLKEKKRRQ